VAEAPEARRPHHTDFIAPEAWRTWWLTEFESEGYDHEVRQFCSWARAGNRRFADDLAAFQQFARNSKRAVPKRAAVPAARADLDEVPALRRPGVSFASGQDWRAAQRSLLATLGPAAFKSWIAALVLAGETGGAGGASVAIDAPTRFYFEWVERNYLAALAAAFGKPVTLWLRRGETA
jgi:hypothetical protein